MLIILDKAVVNKITGIEIEDGISIIPMSKEKHIELREQDKYPAITWERYDAKYDVKRFQNDTILKAICDDDGNIIGREKTDLPTPYNYFYQVELVAKEKYHIDLLEILFAKKINPRASSVTVPILLEDGTVESEIVCPVYQVDYRQLDEKDDNNKNTFYRRVYSLRVEAYIDLGEKETFIFK